MCSSFADWITAEWPATCRPAGYRGSRPFPQTAWPHRPPALEVGGKCAAEMLALLLGDLRQCRKRLAAFIARKRGVAEHIDAVDTGHRQIGRDRRAAGAVELEPEPATGRQSMHAGTPDHRAGRDTSAHRDHAAFVDALDGVLRHHRNAEVLERLMGIGRKLLRKRWEDARPGF